MTTRSIQFGGTSYTFKIQFSIDALSHNDRQALLWKLLLDTGIMYALTEEEPDTTRAIEIIQDFLSEKDQPSYDY